MTAVGDGEDAIVACEQTAFDVVLMDLNLPRIGGIGRRDVFCNGTQNAASARVEAAA